MDIVLDFMRPLAVLAAVFCLYVFVYHRTTKRRVGFYTSPDWNFFAKRFFAKIQLEKIKKQKLINLPECLTPKSENPIILKNETSSDSQMFFGCDQNRNSIQLKLTRLRHRTAELWMILRFADGSVYTLPGHPDTRVMYARTGRFESGGLKMECLQPYSRWRVTFKGYLRKGVRDHCTEGYQDEELVFINFNLFWSTCSEPFFWPYHWSTAIMAEGIASETWRNKNWAQALNVPGSGGYDQFGELFGSIRIGTDTVKEVHLPGIRHRRWELVQQHNLRRSATMIGVCDDGSVFSFGAMSYREDLTHVQFGNIRSPDGEVRPIDWTDFRLTDVAERPDVLPRSICVNFKAGGRSYSTMVYFRRYEKVFLLRGRPFDWRTIIIPLELSLNNQAGFGISSISYPYETRGDDVVPVSYPKLKKLVYSNTEATVDQFTVAFSDDEAKSCAVAGAKGASLALLCTVSGTSENNVFFTVPQGFIVSTAALRYQMSKCAKISQTLHLLEDVIHERVPGDSAEVCLKVEDMIQTCQIDDSIITSIECALHSLSIFENESTELHSKYSYAIRSSPIYDEGKNFSSASENETILGLRTRDEILTAVKKCWASLYSTKSVQYRRQHIQPIITDMAVIVQIMVKTDAAGVLFTHKPMSMDPNKMIVMANYGLTESTVSELLDSDLYVVRRSYDNLKLEIEDKIIGKKAQIDPTLPDNGNGACISNELIIKLSEIGVILEKMFGTPQDIEWAVADNKIYLLQSRQIIPLHDFTDWELLHEFDTPVMSTDDRLTQSYIGEVFSSQTTPLTQSIVLKELDNEIAKRINVTPSRLYNRCLKISHNQVFLDVVNSIVTKPEDETINDAKSSWNLITPEVQRITKHRFGILSKLEKLQMDLRLLKDMWNASNHSKCLTAFVQEINESYSEKVFRSFETPEGLLDEILKISDKNLGDVIRKNLLFMKINGINHKIILNLLFYGKKEFTAQHENDIKLIFSVGRNVQSLEIPKAIEEIAYLIYGDKKHHEFLEVDPKEGFDWLEKNCPSAYSKFRVFLLNHGHRCLKENELEAEPWGMHPELIVHALQLFLKCQKDYKPCDGFKYFHSVATLVDLLRTPKGWMIRKALKYCLQLCKDSTEYQAQSMSDFTALVNTIRRGLHVLADRMHDEGLLPNHQLIFYLTRDEIRSVIKNRDTGLILKATRRRKLFPHWKDYYFEPMIKGVPKPIPILPTRPKELSPVQQKQIYGIPVNGGHCYGRACVVSEISEATKIRPGDILVTRNADIGWSPYIPILGGFITELGGILSHGVIIAREYDLPFLIFATGAMRRLRTGQRIYLDADKGFVGVVAKH